ncbi:hypothetical protein MFLAVUS_001813 [Mucor flavus]|uniref:Uncharacterized protein n=1 Tax=Mucor flavus TaxID=439312 RepID=A0ABP9YNK1_9FUNG
MVLGDNYNPELSPNVKLYLDGKFDDLVTQIKTRDFHSGYLEDRLKEFKKELSDMFENQTQDILKLIKESHKQILETVESKLERPVKDTAKTQPFTEVQPSTTETQPTTEIQPFTTNIQLSTTKTEASKTKSVPLTTQIPSSKKRVRRLPGFPSIGPSVISYLSESDERWDMALHHTSPQNEKVSMAIVDYILKNPTAEILKHREYNMLDHSQKLDILTNKTKNYFNNLRQRKKPNFLSL